MGAAMTSLSDGEFQWLLRNPLEAVEYVRGCRRMKADLGLCPTISHIEQLCSCVAAQAAADRDLLLHYLDDERHRVTRPRLHG
jgi:hypothetical protein